MCVKLLAKVMNADTRGYDLSPQLRRIWGTLTQFLGSMDANENGVQMRQQLNAWMRSNRVFDAVIDFERAARVLHDQCT